MNFETLVQAMCREADIDIATVWQSHDGGAQSAHFVVADHLHSMLHSPADPGRFVLRSDIGPVPQRDQHTGLLELLQLNVALFGNGAPTFGADPGTHRLVALAILPLESVTPASVLRYLESLAAVSERWRRGYLFSTEPHETLADPRIDALKTSLQASMEKSSLC